MSYRTRYEQAGRSKPGRYMEVGSKLEKLYDAALEGDQAEYEQVAEDLQNLYRQPDIKWNQLLETLVSTEVRQ